MHDFFRYFPKEAFFKFFIDLIHFGSNVLEHLQLSCARLGFYNVIAIMDAPDEKAIAKAVLSWGIRGLLKIKTFRVFSPEQMIKMSREI